MRHVCAAVVFVLLVAACSQGDTLDRSIAIEALQTTGVNEAEATCLADTLIQLDELDAADPRMERGLAEREAFIAARTRCVTAAPDTEVAGAQLTNQQNPPGLEAQSGVFGALQTDSEERVLSNELRDDQQMDGSFEGLRSTAILALERFGRSSENATCVVNHIVGSGGVDIVEAPSFGLGLNTVEAVAFAECSSVR